MNDGDIAPAARTHDAVVAAKACKEEREACARIAEEWRASDPRILWSDGGFRSFPSAAAAIRARSS